MTSKLEYFPAGGGDALTFLTGPAAAFRLLNLAGVEPPKAAPQSIKSPGQTGETTVDVIVPPRVVVVQAMIQAADGPSVWALRSEAARALVVQPVRLGEQMALGRLRLTVDGRDPLEVECAPSSVDMPLPKGLRSIGLIDAEFVAPYPYWQELADSRLIFSTATGGFEFSLEFSLEMTTNNVEQEVINEGDVDAPPLMRIYGDATTCRMKNETTGEVVEIADEIMSDEYVEIETAFGKKAITLVNTGTLVRTSIMDRLNLSKADLWTLRPGTNLVKFEADTNVSGHAELIWRQRYSGL